MGLTKNGRVTFGANSLVLWSDFCRAAEAGLIDGDPHELVVFADRGTAGGGSQELFELVHWLFDNRERIVFGSTLAAAAYGLEEAIRRPILWLSKARRQAIGREFKRHGVTASTMEQLASRQLRWDADDFATYFGLTAREAQAALGELGYRQGVEGLFERSRDPQSRLRRAAFMTNAVKSPDVAAEEVETLLVDQEWD